jgi:hypothetical protein
MWTLVVIRMKIIFSLIILLLSSSLVDAEVSIAIGKINNNVEFTVLNIENHVHSKYYGVTVERKENKKWNVIRWDVDCPVEPSAKKQ